MSSHRLDVISIGTLSKNTLWNETAPTRTPHATTSLIRVDGKAILVDPSLPGPILTARLNERCGLTCKAIGTVFFTNLRPAHIGGVLSFDHAELFAHEAEIEDAAARLERHLEEADGEESLDGPLRLWQKVLDRIRPAPDELADGIDLFPLPGFTLGTCGLLVAETTLTTLVAGDAVPTLDHFLAGQVLAESVDLAKAKESLAEAYEIADLIVPGHDNIFMNPRTRGM